MHILFSEQHVELLVRSGNHECRSWEHDWGLHAVIIQGWSSSSKVTLEQARYSWAADRIEASMIVQLHDWLSYINIFTIIRFFLLVMIQVAGKIKWRRSSFFHFPRIAWSATELFDTGDRLIVSTELYNRFAGSPFIRTLSSTLFWIYSIWTFLHALHASRWSCHLVPRWAWSLSTLRISLNLTPTMLNIVGSDDDGCSCYLFAFQSGRFESDRGYPRVRDATLVHVNRYALCTVCRFFWCSRHFRVTAAMLSMLTVVTLVFIMECLKRKAPVSLFTSASTFRYVWIILSHRLSFVYL